jgi:hypothetical protein
MPRRIAGKRPYDQLDRATFYGGDTGYIDYPFLDS